MRAPKGVVHKSKKVASHGAKKVKGPPLLTSAEFLIWKQHSKQIKQIQCLLVTAAGLEVTKMTKMSCAHMEAKMFESFKKAFSCSKYQGWIQDFSLNLVSVSAKNSDTVKNSVNFSGNSCEFVAFIEWGITAKYP